MIFFFDKTERRNQPNPAQLPLIIIISVDRVNSGDLNKYAIIKPTQLNGQEVSPVRSRS